MTQLANQPPTPSTPDSRKQASTVPAARTPRRRFLVPAIAGATILARWLASAFALGVGAVWAGSSEAGRLLERIARGAQHSTGLPDLEQVRDDQFVYVQVAGGGRSPGSTAGCATS